MLLSMAAFSSLANAHDHHEGESQIPEGQTISVEPLVSLEGMRNLLPLNHADVAVLVGYDTMDPHYDSNAGIRHHLPDRHGFWGMSSDLLHGFLAQ